VSSRTKAKEAGTRPPGAAAHATAIDILSDVLGLLRLRGEVLCWSTLSAPWGLGFKADDALFFHIVVRGRCMLHLGGKGEWIRAEPGDLLVIPEGIPHGLVSDRNSRVVPIERLVEPKGRMPGRLSYGGSGPETEVICGRFRFDEVLRAASLPGLPSVLHIRKREGAPEWLELTARYLSAEARSEAPGRELALSRLVDLLFVQTIRHWLSESSEAPLAWMGAARDSRIAAAITLMHERPEHPWDVERLAREVGMSRSRFADRFVELVGEAPSRYLTRWRMHHAARLLHAPGATVASVAPRVGYDSEAAFSRAFKRHMGTAPAAFRRSRGSGSALD
jgi:AraC-like DNA-binding protein